MSFWKNQSQCKNCGREYMRKWRRENTARQKQIQRKSQLWKNYSLTQEEYEKMFRAQQGKCAICGRLGGGTSKEYPLDVEHCHLTGKIRGLVCSPCNLGLGHFDDDPARLRAAADFVEEKSIS